MRVRFEEAIGLWEDGARRLNAAPASERPTLERVRDAIVVELRRRLGGRFTAAELAGLYGAEGTDWVYEIAVRLAPGMPDAWDVPTVAGAAFLRYVREASDYAGGRRVAQREE